MWTTLSVSRWIFLLTFAVVMFLSASPVESYVPIVDLPCCPSVSSRRVPRIKECFEQKPRDDCNIHAFLIRTKKGKELCISPTAQWLQDLIKKGKLYCPPDLSLLEAPATDAA
ncbi:C-C motif chemokine 4-like [Lates japonicus]|uniref:C-C motif chemokine 4-like protein n=1 Tax=Lates japonicus TaxID=270547 RepID=A0AAD3MJ37_LATJO|nr:C-C motif chemokine 4-like protein [Lates japonicus]